MSVITVGYHFVKDTLRDGRPVPADGEWLEHDGPIILCESGLHASLHPFDALRYAPGDTLCLVELDGKMVEGVDKMVARRRRIVQRIDASGLLRAFARQCALDVIHLWDAPEIVRRYCATGDESIRVAVNASARAGAAASARDAAWAAYNAATAANAAAWAWAASDAATAANAAANAAAWAARDATMNAAWATTVVVAQRQHLALIVTDAFAALRRVK